MRAVIAGAGAAGLVHSLALKAAGVRVVAVFDPAHGRAYDLAEASGEGVAVARSLEDLASVESEIACVCSPPRVHVAQAEMLAREGRVVFVEKPVAVAEAELTALRALPRCVPVVQWRAGRALRAVRRAIAHGELGPSPVVSADLAWGRDEAYVRARGESWGCGAVVSVGIHAIDALLWALDRAVVDVSGTTSRRAGAWAETAAVGTLRFEGGALASVRVSFDGGADVTRLVFCGGGVTAVIEGGEADPTASRVTWHAPADVRARLVALEEATPGATGSPLLVPYFGDAIAALREGFLPGDSDRIPRIEAVAEAHRVAMALAR